MADLQPNNTLYINNLNDKVNKEELRHQLFALFTAYGRVIDVVAQKGAKMKGQAFLVFGDLAGATAAMRACEGMVFYDKPMRIRYAKSKSHATLRREDPNFVPPTVSRTQTSVAEKRAREEEAGADGRPLKKERADDSDAEEMEIEEDEDQPSRRDIGAPPPIITQPSARLLCTNLPQEVTDDVLSVLFQQYQGFQSTHVVPAQPNASGQPTKMAQVLFDAPDLASVAKEALDGFTLKKGWVMSVAYV